MPENSTTSFRLSSKVALQQPFWQYAAMYGKDAYSFLLDSAMDSDRPGRFSFLGGNPAAVLKAWRKEDGGQEFLLELKRRISPTGKKLSEYWSTVKAEHSTGDPFETLRALHHSYSLPQNHPQQQSPPWGPFSGGLVGAFGYGLAHAIEHLHNTASNDLNLPDMVFMVADEVLALDHETGKSWLTVTGRGSDYAEAKKNAAQIQTRYLEQLSHFEKTARQNVVSLQTINESARSLPQRNHDAVSPEHAFPIPLKAHFNRASYTAAVQKCRDHIFKGDIFEVCLTHRLEAELSGTPWDLYQVLRHINPAPFGAWLQFPDFQIASASPERFLHLNAEGLAESRPIKGTRARSPIPENDQAIAQELAASEKDRAENVMIVDLVRNDLGKVCRTGSVTVPEMLVVEKYSTVFQLVSTVQGQLSDGKDAFDLVRACFPGGSMTGAPKIEAMQIIDSLEPVTRGLYSGALGYIDATGVMDLSIVIRTLICKNDQVYFGVGGAVVADSDPATEYTETLDKAQALTDALAINKKL